MTLPDRLIGVCHPDLLMGADRSVRAEALPGKTHYQGLKLLGIEFHLVSMPMARPGKLPLVQAACR